MDKYRLDIIQHVLHLVHFNSVQFFWVNQNKPFFRNFNQFKILDQFKQSIGMCYLVNILWNVYLYEMSCLWNPLYVMSCLRKVHLCNVLNIYWQIRRTYLWIVESFFYKCMKKILIFPSLWEMSNFHLTKFVGALSKFKNLRNQVEFLMKILNFSDCWRKNRCLYCFPVWIL